MGHTPPSDTTAPHAEHQPRPFPRTAGVIAPCVAPAKPGSQVHGAGLPASGLPRHPPTDQAGAPASHFAAPYHARQHGPPQPTSPLPQPTSPLPQPTSPLCHRQRRRCHRLQSPKRCLSSTSSCSTAAARAPATTNIIMHMLAPPVHTTDNIEPRVPTPSHRRLVLLPPACALLPAAPCYLLRPATCCLLPAACAHQQ